MTAGLHAAALLWVLIPPTAMRSAHSATLSAFDLPDSSPQASVAAKPKPVRPAPATPTLPVIEVSLIAEPGDSLPPITPSLANEPAAQDAAAQTSLPGGDCDLTDPVQAALQTNTDVRALLPQIPTEQRSVANAIMVWRGTWVHPGAAVAQPAFASIRQTVERTVLAASDACRGAIQRGPRLIYLSGVNDETIVLALGSGQWTWQQVADTAQPDAGQPAIDPFVYPPGNPARIVEAALAVPPEARRHTRR